ncbi:hypothetical protein Dip518_000423 [Parelusimicrobium proximum]|uniref:hypothetical protein n=1 Tax=Parelusimicrobium proximum TaxID=3228953 RepID=UPI003D17D37B
MKLTSKWIFWFAITALYTVVLGGLFCFYLFKFVFDQRLQDSIAENVRNKASTLISGLAVNRQDISIRELSALEDLLNNDDRVVGIIYLNANASIRWYKSNSSNFMGENLLRASYEEARSRGVFPSNSVAQAFNNQAFRVYMYGDGQFYDMAFPLKAANNELAGVLSVQVSRVSTKALINNALLRYTFGAFFVMIVMGISLYIFIYYKIIVPLAGLNKSVSSVNIKDLQLFYPDRKDEFGDLATAISDMLGRVRAEYAQDDDLEKRRRKVERVWWQALLAVAITKGARAMVVDHDNNIMFTNFDLGIKKDGPIHLLDIFDSQQSELIAITGKAMDAPGKVFKGTTEAAGKKLEIRAVQLPGVEKDTRTMIVIEPEK